MPLSNVEIGKKAKALGLKEDLGAFMSDYFKDTPQEGWEECRQKHVPKGTTPKTYWAHPEHDAKMQEWAARHNLEGADSATV